MIITASDTNIRPTVPTTIEYTETLKEWRGHYDEAKMNVAVKLNTWDNPNKGYVRMKPKLTLVQKKEIHALYSFKVHSIGELAEGYNVSKYMINKTLKEFDD